MSSSIYTILAFNILGMYTVSLNIVCLSVCELCTCVLVWVTWKVWMSAGLDHSRWKTKCYWVVPTSTMLQNWNTAGYSSLGVEEHWLPDSAKQSMKLSMDPWPRVETLTKTTLMIHKSITLLSDTLMYIQSTQGRCCQVFESNRELVEHAESFNTEVLQAVKGELHLWLSHALLHVLELNAWLYLHTCETVCRTWHWGNSSIYKHVHNYNYMYMYNS